ncbi:hypothetical protein [Enterococcus gallinarum]|uniref:hypothetical protein n=1 Tax=Enterococcus gallinarum TaxID=1353 RepID=UPI00214CF540|nr:hypothetical protein [Enterococcus gallinarum]MCR1932607.1 hypothetical protein [Enterococcus gallinarum]MDT2693076.1 hypothetical protein [Enterococcus gallinarum]
MDGLNWELIISFVSLVISIASIIYAYFNKVSRIDIVNCFYKEEEPYPMIYFDLVNQNGNSVPIENVILRKNGKVIQDNGYKPLHHKLMVYVCSEPFSDRFYLGPNENETLSYFISENEVPDSIEVVSSHRIRSFSKRKSFSVTFKRIED